jgi:hypothetical protein
VFVNSINGADGLVLDRFDNIWVAANQADEVVVLDPTGKVVAKLGDFSGVTRKGVPQGFLFPASPAFSRHQDFLYVTNLALDIRLFGLTQAVDSQWTAQVKRYTISKIRARIPSSDRHEAKPPEREGGERNTVDVGWVRLTAKRRNPPTIDTFHPAKWWVTALRS